MKKMTKEKAKRCIDGYFKKAIPVSSNHQPKFWDVVEILCVDPNADVIELLDVTGKNDFCIKDDGYLKSYKSVDNTASNMLEFAQHIAEKIIAINAKEVDSIDFFLLSMRVQSLEENIRIINKRSIRMR
ncbi:MAG: hypothetical protein IJ890_03355 [Clostridia bacterium]|nr:hypothetical protein [Clostridia bacterium]